MNNKTIHIFWLLEIEELLNFQHSTVKPQLSWGSAVLTELESPVWCPLTSFLAPTKHGKPVKALAQHEH